MVLALAAVFPQLVGDEARQDEVVLGAFDGDLEVEDRVISARAQGTKDADARRHLRGFNEARARERHGRGQRRSDAR